MVCHFPIETPAEHERLVWKDIAVDCGNNKTERIVETLEQYWFRPEHGHCFFGNFRYFAKRNAEKPDAEKPDAEKPNAEKPNAETRGQTLAYLPYLPFTYPFIEGKILPKRSKRIASDVKILSKKKLPKNFFASLQLRAHRPPKLQSA